MINTTEKVLTESDIEGILSRHRAEFLRKRKLKNYYLGRHDVLKRVGRTNTDVCNRLVNNYPAYITNFTTGFFLGKPVTYATSSEKADELKILLDIYNYNDETAHNLELAEEASITGEAFEVLYLDGDANIRLAMTPSEEMILVADATLEENLLYAIRHYSIKNLDGIGSQEYVDVYDSSDVTHYKYDGHLSFMEKKSHYFDDVPVILYKNNRQRRGDYEDILTLVDAYNKAQSLTLDDMEDFTDAFLVLTGMGGTDDEDAKDLRRRKILSLDGDGADARWLIKNVNDTYIENVKRRLQTDIHKFSNVPDMSDESFVGNTSGVAIKYKLIGLEQIRSRKEREFKRSFQRRIELISGILRLKNLPPIDFRDIDVQFTANIPANVQELAQIVTQLSGSVSQKTLLGMLPFVADPPAELSELARENRELLTEGDDDA